MVPQKVLFFISIQLSEMNGPLRVNMQNQSSRGVLPKGDVLQMCWGFPGAYVHGCDFNKVAKRLCRDCASVLVFSCGFTSFLGTSSLENTSGGLLLNGDNFICNF